MKTLLEILIAIGCALGIFRLILRIIWLYFPLFLKDSSLYKTKEPAKGEMLLYFLAAIICLSYYIVKTVEKLL